jgi:transposase
MSKTRRARYTLEFDLKAVRPVKAGLSVAAVAATLGVPPQSISNWVNAERESEFGGAGTKPASVKQIELSRLRAEAARLKMEHDILKNACAYFVKGST